MKRTVLLSVFLVISGWFVSTAYAASVEVVSIQKITEGGRFSTPHWSPDGQKIYASSSGGSIVVMNADGSGIKTLSSGDGHFRAFALSPDGTKILFEYNENNNPSSNLWMMLNDGTSKIKIADNAENPTWSPDGSKIAFWQSGILTANNEGKDIKRLTTGGAFPKFYGSDAIVYRGGIGDEWAIMLIDLNGNLINSYIIEGANILKTNFYTKEIFYSYEYLKFINTETGETKEIALPETPEDTLPLVNEFEIAKNGINVFAAIYVEDQNNAEVISADIWWLNKQNNEKQNITIDSDLNIAGLSLSTNEDKIVFVDGNDDNIYVLNIVLP